ncbi:related to KRE6-glucan synthase subunit [Sporisorium reilianum f. sp. reilianum]|uniref:Related to KRE6-glucan synthase subunit n=1 Tax=Sporisorium reilianum f. sp. reilianum TaxID=72559 RepID=A0A2N8ULU5_9BASI|nr:related to KRE6-glucan synthase subunit [Sporisorium reilianum f. sp. reilianum]
MPARSGAGYQRAHNPPSMSSSRPSVQTDSSSSSSSQKYYTMPTAQSGGRGYAGVRSGAPAAPLLTDDDDDDDDDYLYTDKGLDRHSGPCISMRGMLNVLTLILLAFGLLALFLGYPLVVVLSKVFDTIDVNPSSPQRLTNLTQRGLIDPDTPQSAMKRTSPVDGTGWHLVFSDEFEEEGRSFWPGDDPYWEAVDLWYWGTGDYEWYSPEAVNTTGGALVIAVEERETNNKNFRSGMVQSWNKVCFQGAYYEISARLPGSPTAPGLWPGLWTQGNLGRPGYGATNEGMWPYSYQGCDTGALPNQTYINGTGPPNALRANGLFSASYNNELSWLPGMRFTSCNCPGTEHPGPNRGVARSVPELDILEAKIDVGRGRGETSQSLQMAPFDVDYYYGNSTARGDIRIWDANTRLNDYKGGAIQEAVSALSAVPPIAYETTPNGRYVTFGVEYAPDWNADGNAYVTWYMDGRPTWTLYGQAIGPVPELDISQRIVPTEPMFMILNVAISESFQVPDFDLLQFPAHMAIDYVRVYQRDGQPDRVGCDPADHPTFDYIEQNAEIYFNANISVYPKSKIPRNRLQGC